MVKDFEVIAAFLILSRNKGIAKNTRLICKGSRYLSTVDLLFYLFGFDQLSKSVGNLISVNYDSRVVIYEHKVILQEIIVCVKSNLADFLFTQSPTYSGQLKRIV